MIPKGYEDFVSSHEELLKQFEGLGQSEQDDVVFAIYSLDQQIQTPLHAIQNLISLRQHILDYLQCDIDSYLWNVGKFNLQIVLAPSQVPCLKGVVVYGNNIEDEWYTVFLLQKLSQRMPNLVISVRDPDGEFLLVEAAEHIESWLSPENAENRVWVVNGDICFIPLETPGKSPSGGMKLPHALAYLSSSSAKRFSVNAMKAINSRTLSVYPAKALAHEHHAACLLPTWAYILLSTYPQLIGCAVRAFSDTEHSQMSKSVSAVHLAECNLDSTHIQLIATTVKLTRTMYAELTFKKFNVPRRFHYWLRQVQGQSTKLTQAFDLGCRIACGLLLAYRDQAAKKKDWDGIRKQNQQAVERSVHKLQGQSGVGSAAVSDAYEYVVYEDSHDTLSTYISLNQLDVYCAFQALTSQMSALCGDTEQEGGMLTKTELEKILKSQVKGDSDSWMYLDPDQLDREMKERMVKFGMGEASGLGPDKSKDKSEGEGGNEDAENGTSNNDVKASEDLQDAVNRFKFFLSEESDYRGIQPSNPHHSKPTPSTPGTAPIEDLDMQYIDNLVDLTLKEVEMEVENGSGNEGGGGVNKGSGVCMDSDDEEEGVECKIEDASDEDSDNEDSEENSSGENGDEDNDEEYGSDDEVEEEGQDMDNYGEDMDAELLQEGALRSTFEDILRLRQEMGQYDEADQEGEGDGVGPMHMTEEDVNAHMLLNMLQSHAEGLGMPHGPAHAMLAQLGIHLPRPPPMHEK